MTAQPWSTLTLLLLITQAVTSDPVTPTNPPTQQRGHLKTSAGASGISQKKEQRITERVKDEIKAATEKFVEGSEKVLKLPLEVDVLLIGFDKDGSYGYSLDSDKLLELLTQIMGQEPLCPHVWDTNQPSMLCYEVNYLITKEPALEQTLFKVEAALKGAMRLTGDRSQEWADGSPDTKVYTIEATKVEAALKSVLDSSVYGLGPGGFPNYDVHGDVVPKEESPKLGAVGGRIWHEARPAIILLNPHKRRMSPAAPAAGTQLKDLRRDFVEEWKSGRIDQQALKDEEGGYVYRYQYNGRGSASTWLSKHNFLVIDLAAGPASFGPLSSPAGEVHPVATPRLLPLLTRMAREIESKPFGTQQARAVESVAAGEQAVMVGGIATLLAAATAHVLAPDIRAERLEFAARVIVPVIILQDHNKFDPLDPTDYPQAVNMIEVQEALDSLLTPGQEGVAVSSRHWMHQHPQIAAALHRARSSTCSAVLRTPPDAGLHTHPHVHVDSAALFEELRRSADYLVQALMEDVPDPTAAYADTPESRSLFSAVRHDGQRVLPVVLFSLREAPEAMMMDNRQLVAASSHMVVALQLIGKEDEQLDESGVSSKQSKVANRTHDGGGAVYSGHMQEGVHIMMDAGESPTRSIIAGLAGALAGLVPPYQRYDALEGRVEEDWRWAVGAQPWGPYSNTTEVSELLGISAQRNMIFSHVEFALRRLHEQLAQVDAFVADNLQGPFGDLSMRLPTSRQRLVQRAAKTTQDTRVPSAVEEDPDTSGYPKIRLVAPLNPHRHWLNLLASRSTAYSSPAAARSGDTTPMDSNVVKRLETALNMVENVLEELGYALYSQEWEAANSAVDRLLREADAFTSVITLDLDHANKVLACCKMQHLPTTYTEVFVVIGFIFLCLAFVALMALGLAKQSRQTSLSRREREAALPSWVLPKASSPRYRV